jgi:hypothetical protein
MYSAIFLKTSITTQLLIEELQLGNQLNQSIRGDRRSDFALMLSMLTDDVRAHSQFSLPASSDITSKKSLSTLRKKFDLPNERALGLKDVKDIKNFSQAQLVSENNMVSVHLTDCLTPKALAFRDDSKFVATNVLSNTSLYCQQQHNKTTEIKDTRLSFDANGWLKAVQNTLVKAPLLVVA